MDACRLCLNSAIKISKVASDIRFSEFMRDNLGELCVPNTFLQSDFKDGDLTSNLRLFWKKTNNSLSNILLRNHSIRIDLYVNIVHRQRSTCTAQRQTIYLGVRSLVCNLLSVILNMVPILHTPSPSWTSNQIIVVCFTVHRSTDSQILALARNSAGTPISGW